AGRPARQDGEELASPSQRGSVDEWDPAAERLVVGEKAGGKIVGAVEQDVRVREQLVRGRGVESGHPRFPAGAAGCHLRLAGAEEHGGLHAAGSSENSRSPGPLTIATPPWPWANAAAAAPACDASKPSSRPTRARARAASARPTRIRSISRGRSEERGRSGS